jgi:16S rRNA (cytidine1402-2'-O)-methyltransferase
VARELTKLHEEARRGTLPELAGYYASAAEPKGEIVLVVGPPLPEIIGEETLDARLNEALSRLSVKDAVAEVSALLSLPRSRVYARALELKK